MNFIVNVFRIMTMLKINLSACINIDTGIKKTFFLY